MYMHMIVYLSMATLPLWCITSALGTPYYKDVEIDTGTVRGRIAEDGDYYAFLGIPYAAPPLGNLRFKTPLPPKPWDDIFIADRTVKCPQLGQGDEDCLILNVFTPPKNYSGPLPVLVYIHGGSFIMGSGQTKGFDHLMRQDIIVVTINYRLGVLGFLCLGIEEAAGNAGLKDQIAALKWVNRNIKKFGGDPNKVTVYGMSAGGASVDLHVLSKSGKELFHGAIVESGASTSVWSIDNEPIGTAKDLAKSLDFPKHIKNWYQLVDYYRTKPAKELSRINYEYYQNLTDGTFGFVPCIERKLYGIKPFLTNTPAYILKTKRYNKVPMMYIFAPVEGLYLRSSDYYSLNYKDKMNEKFINFLPADLHFDSEEIRKAIADNVKYFYFGDEDIGNATLTEYLNYFGDSLIMDSLLNSALIQAKNDNKVYLMEFAYKGKLGSKDPMFEHLNVAGHGDAAKYVMLNYDIQEEDDKLIVDRMINIVANFVKYTNPIPNRTELLPIPWTTITPDNILYLRMDKNMEVLEDPLWERKLFWDSLYQKFRKPIRPVDPELLEYRHMP